MLSNFLKKVVHQQRAMSPSFYPIFFLRKANMPLPHPLAPERCQPPQPGRNLGLNTLDIQGYRFRRLDTSMAKRIQRFIFMSRAVVSGP